MTNTYTITFMDCTIHRKYTREVKADSYEQAVDKIINWGNRFFHRIAICTNVK